MVIPLVDLTAQYASLQSEIDEAIATVVHGGHFVGGREVELFESEIATYCDTKYAVAVASGTDALRLALIACGVASGDEVVTTPFTFIATAESVSQCGATPVFNDIKPETYNIDPAHIESGITPKTKAIIPVHLYGLPADMNQILEISRRRGIKIVEDCAQALGAEYNNQKVGSFGDAGCLSFFPSKTLGAYGDGGMVVTNNFSIAESIRVLRSHGGKKKYNCDVHGFNSRLDTIQAAVLRVKLRHLDEWITARRERSVAYTELLAGLDGIETPHTNRCRMSACCYYTIRVNGKLDRNRLGIFLMSKGISTAVYYPVALHLQRVYRTLGHGDGDFPHSELAQEEVLSLPLYPELNTQQIEWITDQVKEFSDRA